jgi:eukaryotic-like serine/threonine-protein kinase
MNQQPHSADAASGSLVGQQLGNYRILATLDAGGMGNVYRGEHTHLGRPAAIKLLHPELSTNDTLVQRFFNEAKAATAIRHPGIVEVYDFGYAQDGRAYIVMELLEGESLASRLRRGRFTEEVAIQIMRSLASVLKAAHAKGIVHRDLKPDNIFLVANDEELRAKVLDFGVAKLAGLLPAETRHTQTGVLMGTPLYMAPEQARSASSIDHRADLYSMGCILYELLTGSPPFVAVGAGEIIAMHMFSAHQPLRERLVSVSPQLDSLLATLLAKDPDERLGSASELYTQVSTLRGTLFTELSPELANSAANAPRMTMTPRMPTPLPVTANSLRIGLVDERAHTPTRSSMPAIAAIVTLALAAVVALVVALSSDRDPAPAMAPSPPTLPPSPLPRPAALPPSSTQAPPPIAREPAPPPAATRPPANGGARTPRSKHPAGETPVRPHPPTGSGDVVRTPIHGVKLEETP